LKFLTAIYPRFTHESGTIRKKQAIDVSKLKRLLCFESQHQSQSNEKSLVQFDYEKAVSNYLGTQSTFNPRLCHFATQGLLPPESVFGCGLSKPGGGNVTEPGVEPTSFGCMTGDLTHSSEKVSCDEWYWNPSPDISGYMCGSYCTQHGLSLLVVICIPPRDTSPHQDSAGIAPSGTPPPA